MELPVGYGNFPGNIAVNRGHPVKGEETTGEPFHDLFDAIGVATDHAFIRGVDDQQIDSRHSFQSLAHLRRGSSNNADAPIDPASFVQTPGTLGSPAFTGHIMREER